MLVKLVNKNMMPELLKVSSKTPKTDIVAAAAAYFGKMTPIRPDRIPLALTRALNPPLEEDDGSAGEDEHVTAIPAMTEGGELGGKDAAVDAVEMGGEDTTERGEMGFDEALDVEMSEVDNANGKRMRPNASTAEKSDVKKQAKGKKPVESTNPAPEPENNPDIESGDAEQGELAPHAGS